MKTCCQYQMFPELAPVEHRYECEGCTPDEQRNPNCRWYHELKLSELGTLFNEVCQETMIKRLEERG